MRAKRSRALARSGGPGRGARPHWPRSGVSRGRWSCSRWPIDEAWCKLSAVRKRRRLGHGHRRGAPYPSGRRPSLPCRSVSERAIVDDEAREPPSSRSKAAVSTGQPARGCCRRPSVALAEHAACFNPLRQAPRATRRTHLRGSQACPRPVEGGGRCPPGLPPSRILGRLPSSYGQRALGGRRAGGSVFVVKTQGGGAATRSARDAALALKVARVQRQRRALTQKIKTEEEFPAHVPPRRARRDSVREPGDQKDGQHKQRANHKLEIPVFRRPSTNNTNGTRTGPSHKPSW
jgi:hypothetical protein